MKQLLLEIRIYGVKIQRQPVLEINLLICSYFGESKSIIQHVFFINLVSFHILERQVSFCILKLREGWER